MFNSTLFTYNVHCSTPNSSDWFHFKQVINWVRNEIEICTRGACQFEQWKQFSSDTLDLIESGIFVRQTGNDLEFTKRIGMKINQLRLQTTVQQNECNWRGRQTHCDASQYSTHIMLLTSKTKLLISKCVVCAHSTMVYVWAQ